MKTGMTRLGRRSPGRTLAVPRPHADGWLPAGASQWRPHRKGHRWPTASSDQKRIRRMLGALDDAASYGEDPCASWMLAPVWCRLADLLELYAEAEEEICYLALFGQARRRLRGCRTRSPTMTTSARRYGKRVCTPPVLRSGGERSPPPCGPAVTMLPVSSAVPWRLSAAAPPRRCAMSFAASGPRSSRPAPVTQHRKRDRLAGRARQGATRDRALYYAPGRSCCSC
jgi:hypothetical protein